MRGSMIDYYMTDSCACIGYEYVKVYRQLMAL